MVSLITRFKLHVICSHVLLLLHKAWINISLQISVSHDDRDWVGVTACLCFVFRG